MNILFLSDDYGKVANKLFGHFPAPSHIDRTIDTDTKVIGPDGRLIAVLLTKCIDRELHKNAHRLWKSVNDRVDNRAGAVGSPSLPRIRKDGTLSPYRGVPNTVLSVLEKRRVRQGQLGFVDATKDQPCHKTSLSMDRPEMLNNAKLLIKRINELYRRYAPHLYEAQRAEVKKAPLWRLWHTAFTTIHINVNLRCSYHIDRGNLLGMMSAMTVMGEFVGAELVLPRFRISFALRPGDLILFDPQQLHGNLPFRGERLSAIFYCERRIADCGK